MEAIVGVLTLVGLGLAIWAVVYGVRSRKRWDGAATQGFWLRLGGGLFALFLSGAIGPNGSFADSLLGLVSTVGLGVTIWSIVYAVRYRKQWDRSTTKGFSARLGAGLAALIVAGSFTTPIPSPEFITDEQKASPGATTATATPEPSPVPEPPPEPSPVPEPPPEPSPVPEPPPEPSPVPEPPPEPSPAPEPPPEPSQAPPPQLACEPGYSPCVPPYPPDVDCADVDGPITVTGSDPHRLDRDGDGTACEG